MSTDVLTVAAIAGVSAIAVTEPTLTTLSAGAADMASFRVSRTDLVVVPTVVLAAPIAVFLALVAIVSFVAPSADWVVPLVMLFLLVTMFAVPVFKHATKGSAKKVIASSVLTGLVVVALYFFFPVLAWPLALLVVVDVFAVAGYARSSAVRSLWRSAGFRNSSGKGAASGPAPRLVVVLFDELPIGSLLDRDGGIDASLFPNFARFAAMSNWYRNTMTVSTDTRDAVPAMLTGVLPKRENLATAADHPNNLFTLVRDRYTINAWESITTLWPRSATPGAASMKVIMEAWRHHLDYVSPRLSAGRWFGVGQLLNMAMVQGTSFVKSLRARDEPSFDFLHVLLPHRPWKYVSDGRDYEGRGLLGRSGGGLEDPAAIRVAWQRHLLQTQASDRLLGDILDKLEGLGQLDDAVILVAADHGVAIGPGAPPRTPTDTTYHQIGWVPFFLKRSGQRTGEANDAPTMTIDVLPTVADALGLPVTWETDGVLAGTRAAVPTIDIMDRSAHELDMTSDNEPIHWVYDAAPGFAAVFADAARREPASAEHGMYGFGPYADLVGRRVEELPAGAGGELRGEIAPVHGDLRQVKPDAEKIPWVHLAGSVRGDTEGGEVAVAINGVIAGVAALRSEQEGQRGFEIFAMPEAFRAGENVATLYVVGGANGQKTVRAVALSEELATR